MDSNAVSIFAPYYEVDDTAFITKIGNIQSSDCLKNGKDKENEMQGRNDNG